MTTYELVIMAVVLSMDAFAVAVCKGLALKRIKLVNTLWVGLWFGTFQALMPFIGYLLGSNFTEFGETISSWIATVLLVGIGVNMIREGLREEEKTDCSLCIHSMFVLALATSIDALAVGVSYAMIGNINIYVAISVIGIITFVLSAIGVKIGSIFGTKYNKKAQITGGVVLCILGIRILLESYGIF